MKCYQCGYESEQDFTYCPGCGFAAPTARNIAPVTSLNPIVQALKEPLFLVLCILMSASCLLSLAAGSLPLLNILITIFLWLTYSQVKKDELDAKHLRCVSGTIYAQYVIAYVSAALVAICGLIFSLAFGVLAGDPEHLESLLSSFMELDEEMLSVLPIITSISGTVIAVIFIIIAAVMILLNIFSLRYIHRFAKSVYQSIESGRLELKHTLGAKVWLSIFAGFALIKLLSSLDGELLPLLASIANTGCALIPVILIRKHLS